jgi:hypothetical protein
VPQFIQDGGFAALFVALALSVLRVRGLAVVVLEATGSVCISLAGSLGTLASEAIWEWDLLDYLDAKGGIYMAMGRAGASLLPELLLPRRGYESRHRHHSYDLW